MIKNSFSAARLLIPAWLTLSLAWPQTSALLSTKEANQLYTRVIQLMESTSITVPGLARAAAPVLENTRQALANLRAFPGQNHAGLTYTFLENVKAYLALSDSVPKPYPFPDEAQKQFAELREAVDRVESHFRDLLDRKESQLRNPDRDNLRRYADANGKLPPPQPNSPRVVFLGDSITDGWRLNEYFPDHDFVNRGISGQITGEMLGRMKADVIDLKPAAVLILAGTNDIARGVPLTAIENNLAMITTLADANNIKVILASVLPISDYHKNVNPQYERSKQRPPKAIRELNTWIQALSKRKNYVYLDYFSALVDASGFLKAELADDGLHPNAAGYRVMAPLALAAIQQALPVPQGPKKKRRFPFLSR